MPATRDRFEDNDTLLTATTLTLTGETTVFNSLSVESLDDDWFRFRLNSIGRSTDLIRIAFTHALGDVDVALYSSSNTSTPLLSSTGVGNTETISLTGLAAGEYYFRVYGYAGAENPDYSITLVAPTQTTTVVDDIFEQNDTFAQAAQLTLTPSGGATTFNNLIIASGDDDWFKFVLTSPGGVNDFVRISSSNSTDIDLALYNSANTFVGSSTSGGSNESVSLNGLAAGTYYVRAYGYAGASNPNYSLTISTPSTSTTPPTLQNDSFEQNDTFAQATLLPLTGAVSTFGNLVIASGDNDWFKFVLTSRGGVNDSVRISSSTNTDIDLALYNSANTLLTSSTSTTSNESISLSGLAAGTYYVRAYGYAGATNPNYTLTINAINEAQPSALDDQFDRPPASNNTRETAAFIGVDTVSLTNLVLRNEDWYRFTLRSAGGSASAASLSFNGTLGDIDFQLYDSTGNLITGSYGVGNAENINLAGRNAGDYYLRVYGYSGATNPEYSLSIVQSAASLVDDVYDTASANNSDSTATILASNSTIAPNLVLRDEDWYRFSLASPGQVGDNVRIGFDHARGDIDIELYRVSAPTVPILSSTSVSNSETISLNGQAAGDYLVRVYGYNGATNPQYNLSINTSSQQSGTGPDRLEVNNTSQTATIVRPTSGSTTPNLITYGDLNIIGGDQDWFKIVLLQDGRASDYVKITFTNSRGDIDLKLYSANSSGSAASSFLRCSTGVGDSETINLNGLTRGTYFVQVYGYDFTTTQSNNYSLEINAPIAATTPIASGGDTYESNNTRAAAANLGQLRGSQNSFAANIGPTGDEDWYRFTTVSSGALEVSLTGFQNRLGDIDLQVFNSSGATVPLGVSYSTTDSETVRLANTTAGEYFVRAYGYNGATNPGYTLRVNAPTLLGPDALESNNTSATASVIRDLNSTTPNLNITAGDQDWFKFTTLGVGAPQNQILINYNSAPGELKLELYNSTNTSTPITTSTQNGTGIESVSLNTLAAGTYYARVSGVTDAITNPNYSLTINAPAVAPPPAGTPPTAANWTILVYVAGDNDLERFAIKDINEMESVALPSNVNVVVQVDRAPGFDSSNGNWTDTRRGRIQRDTNTSTISSNLQSVGELNMGAPNTLRDFVTWGTSTYSAQNYALVVWDHGGGFSGVAWDDTNNRDNLTLPEIRSTLSGLNLPNLRLVGFDACLMGLTEVASQLAPFTQVLVGSQEIEPGDGWDYNGLLSRVAANPSLDAQQLGTAIVQSYGNFYQNRNTLSAINLAPTAFGALRTAINTFATATSSATSADWTAIINARNSSPVHDNSLRNDRDLGVFFTLVGRNASSQSIKTAATAVVTALQSTVISRTSTGSFSGLGIYLPAPGTSIPSSYSSTNLSFLADTEWDAFVARLASRPRSVSNVGIDNFETSDLRGETVNTSAGTDRSGIVSSGTGNDVRDTASDLGSLVSLSTYRDLSISTGDIDWYGFTLPNAPTGNETVTINFTHSDGDLQLELTDSDGTVLSSSNTSSNTINRESITLAATLAAGDYFVKVSGVNDTVSQPDYTLVLSPGQSRLNDVQRDSYEDNNRWERATRLGSLGVNERRVLTGLTLDDAGTGGDWFVYDPSRITDLNPNSVSISGYGATANLDLEVYSSSVDADNNLILGELLGISNSGSAILPGSRNEYVGFGSRNESVFVHVTSPNANVGAEYEISFARRQLDIDGNGTVTPSDFNLLRLYAAFGADAETLNSYLDNFSVLGSGATRSNGNEVGRYLSTSSELLDIDGNDSVTPSDYNLLGLYASFGADSETLNSYLGAFPNILGAGATRTTGAAITGYIANIVPTQLI